MDDEAKETLFSESDSRQTMISAAPITSKAGNSNNEANVSSSSGNNILGGQKGASSSKQTWTKDKKILYQRLPQNDNQANSMTPTKRPPKIPIGQLMSDNFQQQSAPNDKSIIVESHTSTAQHLSNQQHHHSHHHRHNHHHHHQHNNNNNNNNSNNNSSVINNNQQANQQQPPYGQEHRRRVASLDGTDTNTIDQLTKQPQPNTTIIGHYELKKTLGKGNFSTVKLAHHRVTNHSVAIKVVKTSILSEDNLMKVNREIDVLKKLGKHDHIVRLYQVIKTKRYFMLVTEYCSNGELYEYLVAKGKLSEAQSCNFFLQILSAIEYLHNNNIVHRDLKAENLLLTNDYRTVKIADFGFANYFKRDKLLSTWCGSPPYAAPELFKGLQYIGPPVDIWSMGVILYVLVCGSLPFDGHNLVYLKNRVLSGKFRIPFFMSTECEGLIRGMLRLDPDRRFGIKQIRAHVWIERNAEHAVGKTTPNGDTDNAVRNSKAHKVLAEVPKNLQANKSIETSEVPGSKDNKKQPGYPVCSVNNRGQSLDLDDDKTKQQQKPTSSNTDQEDASMLCLTSSTTSKVNPVSRNQQNQPSSTTMHDFVNKDIANAVSNMSIDSNNSSMSMSTHCGNDAANSNAMSTQSINRTASNSLRQGLSRGKDSQMSNASSLELSKQNSIDDQIIDYMVDNLKVAENSDSIKQSIANDKYDDLHAIYRLIRDQPDMFLKSVVHPNSTFKIPSLPMISSNRNDGSRKPSITTGFFNSPNESSNAKLTKNSNNLDKVLNSSHSETNDQLTSDKESRLNIDNRNLGFVSNEQSSFNECNKEQQNQVIDLATHRNLSNPLKEANKSRESSFLHKQRKSEDQTWQNPPQLFLTPPIEGSSNSKNSDATNVGGQEDNNDKQESSSQDIRPQAARHSFDSTMQQIVSAQTTVRLNLDKLSLSSEPKNNSWDSSILDSLNASSSLLSTTDSRLDNQNQATCCPQSDSMSSNNTTTNPMAGITTNLMQIGQNMPFPISNQNHQLAQLQASNQCTATFTRSGLLPQMMNTHMLNQTYHVGDQTSTNPSRCQAIVPSNFMPNNLVNQNFTNMNPYYAAQGSHLAGNLPVGIMDFLDPNGLNSGLERRASDGQASYSSLTTSVSNQVAQQPTHHENQTQAVLSKPNASSNYVMSPSIMSTASGETSSMSGNHHHHHHHHHHPHHSSSSSFQLSLRSRLHGSSMNSPCLSTTDSSSSRDDEFMANDMADSMQQRPLDLSRGTKCDNSNNISSSPLGLNSPNPADFQLFRSQLSQNCQNEDLNTSGSSSCRSSDQRSNSTTSASLLFHNNCPPPSHNSATTSPRSASIMSSANNNIQIPFCQVSPTTISLSGGGPGHLLNRRKRHSLETESRYHYHAQLSQSNSSQSHQQAGSCGTDHVSPKCRLINQQYDFTGARVAGSGGPHHHHHHLHHHHHHHAQLKYPANSHLGQLRNFAQTFSCKQNPNQAPVGPALSMRACGNHLATSAKLANITATPEMSKQANS